MKSTEVGSSASEKLYSKIIWEGEVIDILNSEENGIIKVRIPEIDRNISDENLPQCFPLFNFSFFRALPKKGERVTLMFRSIYNTTDFVSKDIRYWLSVVHSNVYSTNFQPFIFESNSHYPDGLIQKPRKISGLKDSMGIYPTSDVVSISSRDNASIFLKQNEILLRSGGYENNDPLKFNAKNPSYLIIKNPIESKFETKSKITKKQIFIEPKHEIISQLNDDNKGTVQIKDKERNKVISTQVITKSNKQEVITSIKEHILKLQSNFPYWQLLNFIPELNNLPKVYSLDTAEENVEENIVLEKPINFGSSFLVSDKIFLISHLNNEFNVRRQPNLINEEDIANMNEKAHPIPYGDRLIEFLDLFRKVLVNHVHPYDGMKPVPEDILVNLLNFDLQKLLNKNVLTG